MTLAPTIRRMAPSTPNLSPATAVFVGSIIARQRDMADNWDWEWLIRELGADDDAAAAITDVRPDLGADGNGKARP